MVAALF